MATTQHFHTLELSRRRLLRSAVFVAAGGALAGNLMTSSAAAAPHKMPQQAVAYQPTAKGGLRCDGCTQWAPPNACTTVTGDIASSGWCTLYKPKS